MAFDHLTPRGTLALVLALAIVLSFASSSSAATYTVGLTIDQADAQADGVCDVDPIAPGSQCTLRAAIETANDETHSPGADAVVFGPSFDGGSEDAIALTGGLDLPALTAPVTIDGGSCGSATSPRPCVQIAAARRGITVATDDVALRGLSITGAETGIDVATGPGHFVDGAWAGLEHRGLSVTGSWIGIALSGLSAPTQRGISLDAGASDTTVGGASAAERNVIASSVRQIDVRSTDGVSIVGNYLGTDPTGTVALPSASGIAVYGDANSADAASDIAIGGEPSSAEIETPACDGPCNVIAGSQTGILVAVEGSDETTPWMVSGTTIRGNHVGLDATGAAGLGNAVGISLGVEAHGAVVGGGARAHANFVNGGSVGIRTGPHPSPEAAVPEIAGNFVGFDPTGEQALAPPASIGIENATGTVAANRISMEAGTAIASSSPTAAVVDNVVGRALDGDPVPGGATGIRSCGNLVRGNLVDGVTGDAIHVQPGFLGAIVAGNVVGALDGPDGAGIRVASVASGACGADLGNAVIGGSPADGNEISNTDRAIQVDDGSDVTISHNRGSGNAGPFVDLGGDGAGNAGDGPNGGIQMPVVATRTGKEMSGTARPGATVAIVDKASDSPGEVLGTVVALATANPVGAWRHSFSPGQPHGRDLAISQQDGHRTSEFRVVELDAEAPTVAIHGGPSGPTANAQPTFGFSSEPGVSFACAIDSSPTPTACDSGQFTPPHPLDDGPHTFAVTALDAAGNPSATATRFFSVDTQPPAAPEISGPAGLTSSDEATFTFSVPGDSATFECAVGKGFAPCTSPRHYGGLPDGPTTFQVRAIDEVGNTGPASSRTIEVDTQAPPVTIDSGPEGTIATSTATFAFSSPAADVDGFACALDGAPATSCAGPVSYTDLSNGLHTFAVTATDAAGNEGPTATRAFEVAVASGGGGGDGGDDGDPGVTGPGTTGPAATGPGADSQGSGPGGGAGDGVAVDGAAPTLSVRGARTRRLARRIPIQLRSSEQAVAVVTGDLVVRGKRRGKRCVFKLRRVRLHLTGARTVQVRLKLPAAALECARKASGATAKLKIAISDASGNSQTVRRRLQLRA